MVVMTTHARTVVLVVALALAASLLTLAVVPAKPAQAQAQTFTDTDQEPFPFSGGCTETAVFEDATLYTVAHTTTDANGGFHTTFHFKVKGQGVGLSSGDKYVVNWQGNLNRYFPPGSLPTLTQTETLKIIRQGSATPTDDLQLKVVFHITVNAQGEVTSEVSNVEVVCT
jgi:hypothetical protein